MRNIHWFVHALVIAACLVASRGFAAPRQDGPTPAAGQVGTAQENYVVGRGDVLNITVMDQPEMTGKYTVEPDGAFRFPFIGRIPAAGQTLRQIENELKRVLADGYVKNPQVAANLDQFRGQRVFIFGGVQAPGTYPLTEGTTIIEALVKAGYGAASEAVVVRPKTNTNGPVLPEQAGDAQVIRVNLRELEKDVEAGQLARNITLRDGDTVFVPRVDRNRIFVTGQVKAPGAYSVPEGTTVLQAITLAGGVTEAAAIGRTKIIRLVKGEQKTIKVKLDDKIQPGDTVVVPERLW